MTEVSIKRIEHFRQRLTERHGITLSDDAFCRFCEMRKTKGAALQLSCRLGVHKVDFAGTVVAVLWDRKHGIPVTTLPETAVVYGERQAYKWENGRFEQLRFSKQGRYKKIER